MTDTDTARIRALEEAATELLAWSEPQSDDARRIWWLGRRLAEALPALLDRLEKAEQSLSSARAEGFKAGRDAAAKVLKDRAAREEQFAERHKQNARNYKAREAMHVARIAQSDATAIERLEPPHE